MNKAHHMDSSDNKVSEIKEQCTDKEILRFHAFPIVPGLKETGMVAFL